MADVKITDLTTASLPLDPTDLVEVVQGLPSFPVSRKVEVSTLSLAVAVRLSAGGAQSVSNATFTDVTFTSAPDATHAGLWDASAAARITTPAGLGGWYLFIGSLNFEVAPGDTIASFAKNGSNLGDTWVRANTSGIVDRRTSYVSYMAPADYMTLQAYQASGSARTLGDRSMFQAIRIAPG